MLHRIYLPYRALVEAINACLGATKQKQVFPLHKAGETVSVVCFPQVELFSKYVVVSDVVPCVICLIYAPPNVQAIG